jgi:hypothetical protein
MRQITRRFTRKTVNLHVELVSDGGFAVWEVWVWKEEPSDQGWMPMSLWARWAFFDGWCLQGVGFFISQIWSDSTVMSSIYF